MDNFAKSCKEAGIRTGLHSSKFDPSLLVLGDVQKRAAVNKETFANKQHVFCWSFSAQPCFRQKLSNINQKYKIGVHKKKTQ